ncbi:MAG: ATP synthase F1 subunit epsilon [Firmicutes bacterium]|nr:ATP synthase F1 subunit epsilon [[Eubacterium] siraeum]MCM1488596.1 ATP synthase F1 subunit epsilon [Bacillota bacterium]
MTPFKLEILTPDKLFFDGETENLIVRTTVGDKGILARHEDYVAALPIGKMKVKIDGSFRTAAISEGMVKVSRDKTVVMVQSCEWADEIDLDRAKAAKEKAEGIMNQAEKDDKSYLIAEYKLKRALNRIETWDMK